MTQSLKVMGKVQLSVEPTEGRPTLELHVIQKFKEMSCTMRGAEGGELQWLSKLRVVRMICWRAAR